MKQSKLLLPPHTSTSHHEAVEAEGGVDGQFAGPRRAQQGGQPPALARVHEQEHLAGGGGRGRWVHADGQTSATGQGSPKNTMPRRASWLRSPWPSAQRSCSQRAGPCPAAARCCQSIPASTRSPHRAHPPELPGPQRPAAPALTNVTKGWAGLYGTCKPERHSQACATSPHPEPATAAPPSQVALGGKPPQPTTHLRHLPLRNRVPRHRNGQLHAPRSRPREDALQRLGRRRRLGLAAAQAVLKREQRLAHLRSVSTPQGEAWF